MARRRLWPRQRHMSVAGRDIWPVVGGSTSRDQSEGCVGSVRRCWFVDNRNWLWWCRGCGVGGRRGDSLQFLTLSRAFTTAFMVEYGGVDLPGCWQIWNSEILTTHPVLLHCVVGSWSLVGQGTVKRWLGLFGTVGQHSYDGGAWTAKPLTYLGWTSSSRFGSCDLWAWELSLGTQCFYLSIICLVILCIAKLSTPFVVALLALSRVCTLVVIVLVISRFRLYSRHIIQYVSISMISHHNSFGLSTSSLNEMRGLIEGADGYHLLVQVTHHCDFGA